MASNMVLALAECSTLILMAKGGGLTSLPIARQFSKGTRQSAKLYEIDEKVVWIVVRGNVGQCTTGRWVGRAHPTLPDAFNRLGYISRMERKTYRTNVMAMLTVCHGFVFNEKQERTWENLLTPFHELLPFQRVSYGFQTKSLVEIRLFSKMCHCDGDVGNLVGWRPVRHC